MSACRKLVGSSHGCTETGEITHHALVLVVLVRVDSQCMYMKVVEAGKLLEAVTSEWTFTSVFAVICQQGTGKAAATYRMWRARCSMREKTIWQSP